MAHTQRDSPEGSMRQGQHTFWPDNKEDEHRPTCPFLIHWWTQWRCFARITSVNFWFVWQ